MNSEESARENVTFLKRCWVCDEPHIRSGQTCSRECLTIWASFEDFIALQFILENARWAGAPSEEKMRKEYLRERMRAAVRRLPHSEDLLVEALCEIIEDLEAEQ